MGAATLKLFGRALSFCRCGNRYASSSSSSAAPTAYSSFLFGSATIFPPPSFHYYYSSSFSSVSSCEDLHDSSIAEEPPPPPPPPPPPSPPPIDVAELFRRRGCTDAQAAFVLDRQPFLRGMKTEPLDAKLHLLSDLGVSGSKLVRLVLDQPRFLRHRIDPVFRDRVDFLRTLFTSDADVLRAILRNPSLLRYDLENTLRPCVRLYESVGVDALGFGRLLSFRPAAIIHSSLEDEKLELLSRVPLDSEDPMYKYVVAVLAQSELNSLQARISALEMSGISSDDVMALFAKSPTVLLQSPERIRRNMTFVKGTLKIPSNAVIELPRLLIYNLDTVIKPRYLLGFKLEELGLQAPMQLKEPACLVKVLKLTEARFLKKFVWNQSEDVSWKLMDYYSSCKGAKKLAESSRINTKKEAHSALRTKTA